MYWREKQSGPDTNHYIAANRPTAGQVGSNGKLMNLSGEDYSFDVSATKVVGKNGLFGTKVGTATQAQGFASQHSAEGKALRALEDAVAGAMKLGAGNVDNPLGSIGAPDIIRIALRSDDADNWATWKLSSAPKEVLQAHAAAQAVAQLFAGRKTDGYFDVILPPPPTAK